jgi:hypothetical protein
LSDANTLSSLTNDVQFSTGFLERGNSLHMSASGMFSLVGVLHPDNISDGSTSSMLDYGKQAVLAGEQAFKGAVRVGHDAAEVVEEVGGEALSQALDLAARVTEVGGEALDVVEEAMMDIGEKVAEASSDAVELVSTLGKKVSTKVVDTAKVTTDYLANGMK